MSKSTQKVAVIGAGIAGLAIAIRLAAQGFQVDLFEANDYPGGKLSEFNLGEYRFDAGPSLFTMPQYVEELFELAGEPASKFVYERLPVVCHYFWDDGTKLLAHADPSDFDKAASQTFGIPEGKVSNFLQAAAKKYELTGRTFLEKSLHRFSTWINKSVAASLLQLPSLQIFSSMHEVHQRAFQHEKLVQLFDRFATYNGSDPYRASGMLSMIPHFEHGIGAFFPKHGMSNITKELVRLAKKLNVNIHYNSRVEKISFQDKQVDGIHFQGQHLSFDKVVSNMDVFYTYQKLMPGGAVPKEIKRQERSTSALIFYWGIKRQFEQLGLHNIFFSTDYKAEFEALSKQSVSEDPTVYINISSKCNPSDAPDGCENWFTMINVPYADQISWEELIPKIRQQTIAKIKKVLGLDISPYIVEESVLDPNGIEHRTSSFQGALYGTSSNTLFSAFLRHANFKKKYKNLYFCGGSVHPGGGIPLCLLSAKIVAEAIEDGY